VAGFFLDEGYMPHFDKHSSEVLEYHKILALLKGLCLTGYGVTQIDYCAPGTDIDSLNIRLDEISQMKDIIRFGENFPLYRLEDISDLVRPSVTEGATLEPKELNHIRDLIEVGASLHDYAPEEREKFPLIDDYLRQIHPLPDIKKAIVKSIDRDGQILDSASSQLRRLRSEISGLKGSISSRLQKIMSSRPKSPGWQDDTIIQREGRYVIPIPAGQFRPDSGIIHDRSHSGATLFVEPNNIIEANNKLGMLIRDERVEVLNILRHLTAMIGEAAASILANGKIIGLLDSIHAAAGLSIKTDSRRPGLTDNTTLSLIAARHPLLLYHTRDKERIVANDFILDDNRLGLIITGPNTGGKTVALKTVGLLALMVQTGLHIPADHKSEMGIFDNVFADIGDEQSIELSLSTFSSHARQIIRALKNSGPGSLVLLDEIGAGTDPKEGSALAEAIILKLIEKKCKMIVTTHYSQLKTLPMANPEIENASFEFDRDSLEPTFRLYTGIPGASYAVEIAHRLGMPDDIITRASGLLGKSERSLTDLISSLEKELTTLREDRHNLEEKLNRAVRLEKEYRGKIDQVEGEIESRKKSQLHDLEEILEETRLTVEKLVKDIRERQADKTSVKEAHKFLQKRKNRLKNLRSKPRKSSREPEKLMPGDIVWVKTLEKEGEFAGYAGTEKAKVRIGNIMSVVRLTDLKKNAGPGRRRPKETGPGGRHDVSTPEPEIHLRGMTADEACEALDKFLDSAVLAGLGQVYVIHGKGTGALRKKITAFLKQHAAVESFRLGDWNEGGAGVTIVHLK